MDLQKILEEINFSNENLIIPNECEKIKILKSKTLGEIGIGHLNDHLENFLNENPNMEFKNASDLLIKLEKYIKEKGLQKRAKEEGLKEKSDT